MNIAFIGPGIMPIPPNGWGAVEMLIWDYYLILKDLGHSVTIINTSNRDEILQTIRKNNFDTIHLHYDVFYDIIDNILSISRAKLIVSSHYPYINNREKWNFDNYAPIMERYARNNNFYIFASSQNDINTFVANGALRDRCWLSRLGVHSSAYAFESYNLYDRTLCFSLICDRKRQYLIQNLQQIDFVGRLIDVNFQNYTNYKGEYSREHLNNQITKYANFILLSSVENTTPLVVKEALICGLGVVVSETVAIELDLDRKFIDVIPENKITDINYINSVLQKNKAYAVNNRNEIREYGLSKFSLHNIVKNQYIVKIMHL